VLTLEINNEIFFADLISTHL